MTKYCVNCRHSVEFMGHPSTFMCFHPENGRDIVTGQINYGPCVVARRVGICKTTAIFYEEKDIKKKWWHVWK